MTPRILEHNPLAPDAPDLPIGDAHAIVCWSGTLADRLFDRDPRTWLPSGKAALDAWLDRVEPTLRESNTRLLLRPHARHVIADGPRAVTFHKERCGEGSPVGLALDLAALFEADMIAKQDEHLERFASQIGPIASLMLLTDCERPRSAGVGFEETPSPRIVPLGEGDLDAALVESALSSHVPAGTPRLSLA
ncbi:MAG: hypothetical protein AAGD00_07715 [Planctomycetota bacterium]